MLIWRESEIYYNCVNSNKLNLQNPGKFVEHILQLKFFGTLPKTDLTLLPKNEQKPLKVLHDTVEKMTDNHYSVSLL